MIRTSLRFLFAAGLVLMCVPMFSGAESVLWSSMTNQLCHERGCGKYRLDGISQQVSYNVRVVNENTGAVIPKGSTVAAGTQVRYEFLPHKSADIVWFRTGYGTDSPNGDWVAGAGPVSELCTSKNFVGIIGKDRNRDAYADLVVAPPAKSILNLPSGCGTASDGVSKTCTLSNSGTVNAQFSFAATQGTYYGEFQTGKSKITNSCGEGTPLLAGNGAFVLSVPAQTISYPLTVESGGSIPTSPAVTPGQGGACVVGSSYALSMLASDPGGGNIRYGVDWDANGSIDEFVPATGYVPSGTTQQASRTYATSGSKTVSVIAQNESGFTSGWTTVTFSCTNAADADLGDITGEADDFTSFSNGFGGEFPLLPTLSLRAVPSLVRSGDTTRLHWSATSVSTCTVRGTNGDLWEDAIFSEIGGNVSRPITEQVTYTLTCLDHEGGASQKNAVVNVSPVFQEVR